ncbi:MAG TPA: alpha/beta hydrolase [Mycobacteriales bacterium]|nr:alpha/beta hydrolase [Mycobacteriales bacterium]
MVAPVAVRREVVSVRGVDVQVKVYGDGGTPVVLLSGGGAGCNGYFPDLIEGLPDHTVVEFDRLGTGTSRTTERVSLRSWSQDTITVLDALGIKRAFLVGHSLGGALAAQILADYPDRVAGAFLLDPTPLNNPKIVASTARAAILISKVCGTPVLGPVLADLLKRTKPKGLSPSAEASFGRTFSGPWLEDTAAAVRLLEDDARAYCARSVPPAGVPVLIASADRKPAHRFRRVHAAWAQELGGRLEVWPNTKHSLYLQEPQLVVDRTRALLEESA